ncbi:GGDEF domain-containing protein [Marinomonas sp.]|nr:GGDEF domain-containing protein [Marinomonas sp.]MDB4837426.1 GGDEF domain-containing protein [Marinomonas sp.]
MTIKSRFLISITLILLLTGVFSWFSVRVITDNLVTNWVSLYAEKQLKYDEVRTLLPLTHELDAAKEFASLNTIIAWAKDPNNESLKHTALKEASKFRHRFSDNAFFIALSKNNQYYYYDDNIKTPDNTPLNYTLDKSKKSDAWFYSLIDSPLEFHLNINPDVNLGVVKLWSDVLIRDENGNVIAAVGSGLDLSSFVDKIVSKQDINSAITFTNLEGAIQLHQEESKIDYGTIAKQHVDKKLIFQLLDDAVSKVKLQHGFDLARQVPNSIEAVMVNKNGLRQLASIIYIPEVDWFQVNFIEIDRFLPWTEFSGFLVVLFISLVCALIIVYILITFMVLKPLKELDKSILSLKNNECRTPKFTPSAGLEIKKLMTHYQQMSHSLLGYQHELESKVAERTQELNLIAQIDPLTQLYNRRGFDTHMTRYMDHWQQDGQAFYLINIDIDFFKSINDQYGHAIGDNLLQEIAAYLKETVGDEGETARWGGDEFLILAKADNQGPNNILESLKNDCASLSTKADILDINISFSFGYTCVEEGDSIEKMLHRADKAMYKIKFANR